MVLWTIIPPEIIFGVADNNPSYKEINVQGTSLLVEQVSSTHSRVVRLLSTCPDDYLRPEFQPGALLEWRLTYQPV